MATDTLDKKHTDHSTDNASWEGGEYPFKVGYGKLMIWYFLLSDAFTFAGFLIAYGTLRFSSPSWPVPDFVFSTFPFLGANNPLLFVTLMTFVLLFSSFTMIRAVQEGHRENRRGVVKWMALTIVGGLGFLGCQAWEWTTLIATEHMTVSTNPFGTHTEAGVYLGADGKETDETFDAGSSYLIHKMDLEQHDPEAHGDAGEQSKGSILNIGHAGAITSSVSSEHAVGHTTSTATGPDSTAQDTAAARHDDPQVKEEVMARIGGAEGEGTSHQTGEHEADNKHAETASQDDHSETGSQAHGETTEEAHDDGHGAHHYPAPGDYPDAMVDERGYIHRKFIVSSGENAGMIKSEEFGPKAFGALFFFITGFHGFHVFSGVLFLIVIMVNVMSGIYVKRRNGNEMVEKIGLYWHFVDLVWVFVFLVFYLL
jgi:cytochrome c oxidase subunit 3